jgi:scyllo-inositol 2-dehydrogenase (NADP+)
MEKKLNVAILGFGMSGQVFHGPMLSSLPYFNISKILTSNLKTKDLIAKAYPKTKVVDNIEDILKDKDIDLVFVCTPNIHHYKLAKQVLMAGKNVVVEKPFTVTSQQADELIQLSKEKNKVLSVYQNRRWDSDFLTVKKIIDNRLLGDIVEYEAHFDRYRNFIKDNWREENTEGAGMLYDLGSHLIDQALVAFGLPNYVYADIRKQRKEAKVDDNFEIILGYNNLKVTLKVGMLVRGKLPRYILLGSNGSFVKYGMDNQEDLLKQGYNPKTLDTFGKESEDIWGELNCDINGLHFVGKIESEKGNYKAFYENIYKAILGEEDLKVDPKQSRDVIRIIELCNQSAIDKNTILL